MNADQAFSPWLESAINRVLRWDPDTLVRLGELEGRVIRVRTVGTPPWEIYLLPSKTGLQLRRRHDGEPDVTLTGDIPVFARLAIRRLNPDMPAAGDVQISGDIDLGQRFQRLLEKIDIDWEAQAARVLGDVAAHQLGNALRDMHTWSKHARQTLAQDFAEYLQEESRLLPSAARAETFGQAVETLRQDVDHLEQRLERLFKLAP
ncbi:MAG: ubiquinone biosynthesis accessory factor UbiJ [Sulfuricaulis sp.]